MRPINHRLQGKRLHKSSARKSLLHSQATLFVFVGVSPAGDSRLRATDVLLQGKRLQKTIPAVR